MTADIGNAFFTAPCAEKIWSIAVDQFGEKKWSVIMLRRVLYGLKTASASFHKFLGDFLQEMGFPLHVQIKIYGLKNWTSIKGIIISQHMWTT
eukprot:6810569-Ditylum_brightwellii.AAC.1